MIVGALLARNEADRYLRRVLDHNAAFCDTIVVLDDHSTDATPDLCRAHPAVSRVEQTEGSGGWWGGGPLRITNVDGDAVETRLLGEAPARAQLWQLAVAAAGSEGWVLVFDADMLLAARPQDVRAAVTASAVNAWAWPLYDLWNSEVTYRCDRMWQAHHNPRVWLLRAMPHESYVPEWNTSRKLHVGHAPSNYPFRPAVLPDAHWLHLSYVKPEDRAKKAAAYLALA